MQLKTILCKKVYWLLFAVLFCAAPGFSQPFIHPGISQSSADLAHMRSMVLAGKQPYKAAFDRLKKAADTVFVVRPATHVLRGPYGRPNIGGDDLSKSANMAYNYALVWYITRDQNYANKAIAILNAWSPVLQDFDYNDAKLLAAWTGHLLCNAAEILRYSNAGWQPADIAAFSNMLMTVYYPLLRFYFPQANGNWDGAIIHAILAIAIFTENRTMFNNAVDHYLHAPVNGSLFKYIYPNGQCQESGRDQGHVQLGLGEFAGAAQIAYTQGVDLFSIAGNRLALGYEYTAKYLLGQPPHCYCTISPRATNWRDDYEYTYRHYTAKGIAIPFTTRAADSIRPLASRSVLTAVRKSFEKPAIKFNPPAVSNIGYIAGAGAATTINIPATALLVDTGESIQAALDVAAGTGKWVVAKAGIHTLPTTLRIPSRVTLSGEGLGTILFLNPASGAREAVVNAEVEMQDVTIRDLVIEGSPRTNPGTDPNSHRSFKGGYNRAGILFRSQYGSAMKNITLQQVSIQNCTFNGVFISGATNVNISRCDFNENGSDVVPGPRLQHNLLLSHCDRVSVTGSRMATSPFGSGIALDHCGDVVVEDCEIARNGWYGVLLQECNNITIKDNLVEANDRSGVMLEFLRKGSSNVRVNNNLVHYNAGYGIEAYAAINTTLSNNRMVGNGQLNQQQKISNAQFILME